MIVSDSFLDRLTTLATDPAAQPALATELRAWMDVADVARARVFALVDDGDLAGAVALLAGFHEADS